MFDLYNGIVEVSNVLFPICLLIMLTLSTMVNTYNTNVVVKGKYLCY